MEMIICGTAAAEGVPALFCQCPVCRQARVLGGRELRTRSAYQLGEQVRIDFGPDAHHHALCYELDYRPLRHLLLTHAHWDHWVPHELHWRSPGFSQVPEDAVLHVYGNELARQRLHEELPVDPARCRIAFHLLEPWQPIELPEAGLTLVPVLADHARDQDCYNFLIGHGDAWALQGNDTGWYPQETWDFLRSYRLDVALFDSTCGRLESWRNHLGCEGVVAAFDQLAEQGSLKDGARRIATHFSHNGGMLHRDLEAFYAPYGIEPAYDGIRVKLGE